MESLHGGRAYSASNRFPSRMRNTGRSGLFFNEIKSNCVSGILERKEFKLKI